MRMPVFCSMVSTSSLGPPHAYAALILLVPLPGIGTMESRGIDISTLGPLPVCSTMIVSVRWPTSPPVPRSLRCSSVRSPRESLPTIRYVVPGCSAGRSPPGSASTLSTLPQAQNGTATRNTSHSRKTQRSSPRRSRGRNRPRERPEPAGAGRGGEGGCRGGAAGALARRGSARAPEGRGVVGIIRVSSGRDGRETGRVGSAGDGEPEPLPLP